MKNSYLKQLKKVWICFNHMGLVAKKTVFGGLRATNRQTSLISAFVICFLESIISKLASSEISIFYLVSVAEETGSNLNFS